MKYAIMVTFDPELDEPDDLHDDEPLTISINTVIHITSFSTFIYSK